MRLSFCFYIIVNPFTFLPIFLGYCCKNTKVIVVNDSLYFLIVDYFNQNLKKRVVRYTISLNNSTLILNMYNISGKKEIKVTEFLLKRYFTLIILMHNIRMALS